MLIKCLERENKQICTDRRGAARVFKDWHLLTPRGELKEAVAVYWGGPFFKGPGQAKPETKGIPWVFSTFDEDRDEERIDPAGWMLDHYRKNPVVLWSHDSRIPAIGYAEDTAVRDLSLSGQVVFNDKEVDPFGWGIGARVAAGAIRAGSVGFMVHKVEIQENGGESTLIFRAQELLEFSLCNVPSNPYALHQGDGTRQVPLPPLPEDTGEGEIKRFWQSIIQG